MADDGLALRTAALVSLHPSPAAVRPHSHRRLARLPRRLGSRVLHAPRPLRRHLLPHALSALGHLSLHLRNRRSDRHQDGRSALFSGTLALGALEALVVTAALQALRLLRRALHATEPATTLAKPSLRSTTTPHHTPPGRSASPTPTTSLAFLRRSNQLEQRHRLNRIQRHGINPSHGSFHPAELLHLRRGIRSRSSFLLTTLAHRPLHELPTPACADRRAPPPLLRFLPLGRPALRRLFRPTTPRHSVPLPDPIPRVPDPICPSQE
jgi:hypothetical protein